MLTKILIPILLLLMGCTSAMADDFEVISESDEKKYLHKGDAKK